MQISSPIGLCANDRKSQLSTQPTFHHDVLDLGGQTVNLTKSSTVLQAIV
jgi:hypothetical protein